MRDRLVVVGVRALPLLALAALLGALVARSSLVRLLPLAPGVVLALAAGGIALGLLPALLAARSPLPASLAVVVPIVAAAAYDQSRLDWLRLLKDFGVARPGDPDWARLATSLAALLLAWSAHALDAATRLRRSAVERGIAPDEARAAGRLVLRRGFGAAGLALAGAAVVGLLALGAQRLDVGAMLGGRAAIVVPLVAVLLVAVAAMLVVGRDRDAA